MTYRKKLIEVALPLDAINVESAREKSIRHGHPSTLHIWWARRPLAACRAVIFASLVDDPSSHPDFFPTEEAQTTERERLFAIIRELVKWENSNNEIVLQAARTEILRSTNGNPPPLLDPFCGGGSIPLEGQRLGLKVYGSDLNPVAVLITKALIEIPPKFKGRPPVNPAARAKLGAGSGWVGARNLAEDVHYYGKWMFDEAKRRIGYLYPKAELPNEYGGGEATVIAWIWARTVRCPNPVCGAQMPLVRSFWLCQKPKMKVWSNPIVDHASKTVHFEVPNVQGKPPEGTVNRQGATCIVCGTAVPFDYVSSEGRAKRMGAQLMAIVAEGRNGRFFLSPTLEQETLASSAQPAWVPETELPEKALSFRVQRYGMTQHRDLFTPRQLMALTTFSDLVGEARKRAQQDAVSAGLPNDGISLEDLGTGATAYGDAIATYLAFAVDRGANYWSSLTPWGGDFIVQTFGRQALPMVWDYAEGNPLSNSTGNWLGAIEWISKCLSTSVPANGVGSVEQVDASSFISCDTPPLICTDPPYYDNIGYGDLSDFFYVWLRHSLNNVYPSLFRTMLVPKDQELIATPHRFGGSKEKAQHFFEEGLGKAFAQMQSVQSVDYPLPIFYAFKQAESEKSDGAGDSSRLVASTGWETMLEGLLGANFVITGTWPMRTERDQGLKTGDNVLASSIILICRPRPVDVSTTTRRDFLNALKRELPRALRNLQHGNIAPVDLAQATIGPGMAIFSRYSCVMEADGSTMPVRTALQLINQALDEVLSEQEGEFDADTRWALAWFEQFGTGEGSYGDAETLSKAKNTSVAGLAEAGLLVAKQGKVRLLSRSELPSNWDPSTDNRLTTWEVAQQLIRALDQQGEGGAAALLARMPGMGEIARDLAYRLYIICERKGWAQEAIAYNSLVIAWRQVGQLANEKAVETPRQQEMFT